MSDPFGLGGITSAMAILGMLSILIEALQFVVPMYLLVRLLPHREDFPIRATCALLGILAYLYLMSWLSYAGSLAPLVLGGRYAFNFIHYAVLALGLGGAVLLCYDTSVYNAAFAASAAYTIQNLGTGLGELVRILLGHEPVIDWLPGIVDMLIIPNASVVCVVLLSYPFFIRKVEGIGHLGPDSRAMLLMVDVVILVVIAYDVVIRGMGNISSPFGFQVTLRLVHMGVCVFILYAEYEMLFNARLKTEVAMAEQLSAERARQYELSRETIAAVNRRVHDIRHKVLRELDGASVDRETLAEVARDIDVYGSMVRTGHEALDTILTEKSLICQREGITLSCIADGSALMWMADVDLYALFEELFDIVLDEVRKQEDPELRTVSFTLRRAGIMAALHAEYFHAVEDLRGVEISGLRSQVECLGGSVATGSHGMTGSVDVLLPAS